MQFRLNLLSIFLVVTILASSQNNSVLFSIDGNKIYLKEFERAFNKHYKFKINENKDSTRSFLNQYIDYKLKVTEAKKQNLNRGREFNNKIKLYRSQLIEPYLADKQMLDKLSREVYERMKTEIRINQILIKVSPYADPKDTLLAYHKAVNVLKRLESGVNFGEMASQFSDDPSAAKNKGDLWYVAPLSLPYRVENYIYNEVKTKFSHPIRSELGYHIIKVVDKRPSTGIFKVAHIMVEHSKDTSKIACDKIKSKIDDIYRKLLSGENFKKLAIEYSDDKSNAYSGGELPWFKPGSMPHQFEEACMQLHKEGEFSKPVETNFGWHIIKLISTKDLPPYEQIKELIENEVLKSRRGRLAKEIVLEKIKDKYQFIDYRSLLPVYQIVDSTIFDAAWKCPEYVNLEEKTFEFSGRVYFQKDFVKYLETNQERLFPVSMDKYIQVRYNQFIEEILFDYEATQLEKNNIQIEQLINEFTEDELVIELANRELSTEPSESELLSFYNKNKASYNKNYVADVSIFAFTEDMKKVEKLFMKLKKKGNKDEAIVSIIKSNVDIGFELIERNTIEEGQNDLIDKVINEYKSGEFSKDDKLIVLEKDKKIVWLNSEIRKTDKNLEEVKELVINDYKKSAESLWIQRLKGNYNVDVNENTFESIFIN